MPLEVSSPPVCEFGRATFVATEACIHGFSTIDILLR